MVEPIFLGALLNKLTYIYNIITKMVYEISMNQNGNDIVKVTNEVYSTHTVTDIQTHRQTMAVEGGKQIEKKKCLNVLSIRNIVC